MEKPDIPSDLPSVPQVKKHLSESEQFRFGVAFQIALVKMTGLRFIVIDHADPFDEGKGKC